VTGSMTELAEWAAVKRDELVAGRAWWRKVLAWLAEWQVAAIPEERVVGRLRRRERVLGGCLGSGRGLELGVMALEAVARAFCWRRRWPAFLVRWQ
jgi:hypothetical protein